MQPNPNPNNKETRSINAPVTFQTYLITPIGLNEVQLRSRKVIRLEHAPIITEEECESPRKDIVNSETIITHVIFDTTPVVTPIAASLGRHAISTPSNPSTVGVSMTANSVARVHDPPYPQ